MGSQINTRKAGLLLRQTAKDYLTEYCYEEEEIEEILQRASISEIEKKTGVVSTLDAVIHKLCPMLAKCARVIPPSHMFSTLMTSEHPEKSLKGFLQQLERCSGPRRAELVIMMLSVVHDEWIKNHEELFFDLKKQYLRCRFMPLELVGFEVARQYYVYIERLIDLFGWVIDERLLLMAYRLTQDNFYLRYELCSDEKLVLFVADAEYKALSPRIRKALKGNLELARKMVYS